MRRFCSGGANPIRRRRGDNVAQTSRIAADFDFGLSMNELENPHFWYAMAAIAIVAIIYTIDSRIGLLLAGAILIAALGNMFSAGLIKPAKGA